MNAARLAPRPASPGSKSLSHAVLPPERVATKTSANGLLPESSDRKSPTGLLIVG